MPLSAHEFERRLIFYASPTLTKLKVACMYNLNDLDDLEECIDYYNEILKDNDIELIVITVEEKVVGYTIIRYVDLKNIDLLKDRYYAYIDEICIKETFRRQGLGKFLFEYIYNLVKNKGADSLELGVWSFNKAALEFYKAMGMVEKNIRMEKK